MKQTLGLLSFLLLSCLFSTLVAQEVSVTNRNVLTFSDLNETEENNWTFYTDEENKIYYIDFENIQFNLSDIVVRDMDGNILFKDDVLHLPVNTIYELDLSSFESGIYQIELRSFTEVIKKQITFNAR